MVLEQQRLDVLHTKSKKGTRSVQTAVIALAVFVGGISSFTSYGTLQHFLKVYKGFEENTVSITFDTDKAFRNDRSDYLYSSDDMSIPNISVANATVQQQNTNITLGNTTLALPGDIRFLSSFMPLPKPIIVVGMPKTGTTTISDFFNRTGHRTSHWRCQKTQNNSSGNSEYCGLCIADAIKKSLPPLKTCGDYDVWAQLDFNGRRNSTEVSECSYPQITHLEDIHREAPSATFLLNHRPMDHWIRSLQKWGDYDKRMPLCSSGPKSQNVSDLSDWLIRHRNAVREFVRTHPSHALIEFDIEDPNVGYHMATLFQTSPEHWGHQNANKNPNPQNASIAPEAESRTSLLVKKVEKRAKRRKEQRAKTRKAKKERRSKGKKRKEKTIRKEKEKRKRQTKSTKELVESTINNNVEHGQNERALFKGSRKTNLSPGLDLYEDVCIEVGKRNNVELKAYTFNASDIPVTHPNGLAYIHAATGYPIENWYADSRKAQYVLETDTLWTHILRDNPGHCMNDMTLNLALDYYNRQRSDVHERNDPFYANYLASTWQNVLPWKKERPINWCYSLLESAGFIDPKKFVGVDPKPGIACFRRLLVPTLTIFRYPDKELPGQELYYPSDALELLRDNACRTLDLSTDPWQDSSMRGHTQDEKQVLLHIRATRQKRKMLNADILKQQLEENYRVNITILQEDWLTLSFEEQARVYNSWEYVLTVHGAHEANAIFFRPKTKIVEFFCSQNPKKIAPDPNLTRPRPETSTKEWYGDSGFPWFSSWTRKLQIEHFLAPQSCPNMTTPKRDTVVDPVDMELNLDRQIPLVVNRFGLEPR